MHLRLVAFAAAALLLGCDEADVFECPGRGELLEIEGAVWCSWCAEDAPIGCPDGALVRFAVGEVAVPASGGVLRMRLHVIPLQDCTGGGDPFLCDELMD